jgi:hypothetical protein
MARDDRQIDREKHLTRCFRAFARPESSMSEARAERMSDNEDLIHRRGLFLRVFELEGFCQGLLQAISVGQLPGPMTEEYFRILVKGASEIIVGPFRENIPKVGPQPSPADMLIMANVLKSFLTAFLTPDEREEQRAAEPWGLAQGARRVANTQ